MYSLIVSTLFLCLLVPNTQAASNTIAWCYNLPTCGYPTWPTIAAQFCNGSRQSPININTSDVTTNANLTAFNFINYGQANSLTKIENTGKTIKVAIASGVGVSGGGLAEAYDSLQFHLHWGNKTAVPGSEHTVDGKQFPMELHIVNSKSSLNGNTTLAVADPEGLAALGFFIEALTDNSTGTPASWKTLTSYLANITAAGDSVTITDDLSLNDLLGSVNVDQYWRYNGSLTTPACNEAVVWTVFKESIKISQDLIDLFSTTVYIDANRTELMTNVYRGVQSPLPLQQRNAAPSFTVAASFTVCLVTLGILLGHN